jgi:hypothetical protein
MLTLPRLRRCAEHLKIPLPKKFAAAMFVKSVTLFLYPTALKSRLIPCKK